MRTLNVTIADENDKIIEVLTDIIRDNPKVEFPEQPYTKAEILSMLKENQLSIVLLTPELLITEIAAQENEGDLEHSSCLEESRAVYFTRKNEIQMRVSNVLHDVGIPANIKGYQYLREAIIEIVQDASFLDSITKTLYPTIAKIHGSTPSRVERAMRHAIDVAWKRGNTDKINDMFQFSINRKRGKPTNSEFMALIADRIRLGMKI